MISNNYPKFDMDKVKRLSNGNWHRIYPALAPRLNDALEKVGSHVPCPVHGGKDGFRFRSTYTNSRQLTPEGYGLCNTCTDGKRQDGIAILMLVNGWSFPEAVKEVMLYLDPRGDWQARDTGRTPIRVQAPVAPPPVHDHDENKRRLEALKDVWKASYALEDPESAIGRRYFASRGLKVPVGLQSTLRFVTRLAHYEQGKYVAHFPALVAKMVNVDGQIVTLHRIYLAPDGSGKAPVAQAKKAMAYPSTRNMMGAAIRLSGSMSRVLAVTEGIETACAVHQMTGFTTWSTVASTFMEAFIPPPGVEAIWVWGDKDVSGGGQESTQRLVDGLRARGLRATPVIPPWPIAEGEKSIDWLNVLNTYGDSAWRMLAPFQRMGQSESTTVIARPQLAAVPRR